MSNSKLLWKYMKPHWGALAFGTFCVLVAAGLALVQPRLIGAAVDNVNNPKADHSGLWLYALAIVVFAVIAGVFAFMHRFFLLKASREIELKIRADMFTHLQSMHQGYFQENHTGDLMSRATNDLSNIRMFLGAAIGNVTNTVFLFVLAVAQMFSISVGLTLIVMITLPVVSFAFYYLGARMQRIFEDVQAKLGKISTHAQENFSGIRVVKAYAQEDLEIAEFSRINQEYINENLKYVKLSGLLWPLTTFILGLATAFVLWIGSGQIINKEITLGQFIEFNGYLALLSWPMIALGWVVNLYQRGMASTTRIGEILIEKPAIVTAKEPVVPQKVRGQIEFRDVGLNYKGAWALRHLSFTIPAGSTTAIIGATGAGKTTLVNLLARVTDPQEGEILLDGVDIRKLPLDLLRRNLGYVPQDTFLFSLPLAENIAFGVEDYKLENVYKAAETARLSKDLEQIPGGLEAMIGERGVTLSGGQKQRTAIARAVLRDPTVLILDDALSSIDTQTQAEIINNLKSVMAGRTSLVISQRISTIKDSDQIIVIEDGKVLEQGNHLTLLKKDGLYSSMYRRELLSQELEGM